MGNVHYIHRHGRRIAVETLDIGPLPKKRHREQFVKVPETWLRKLSTMHPATRWLAVVLLWKFWRQYRRPFACGNLEEFGISRYYRDKGLTELEQAGMIVVHRSLHRAPRVEMVVN
jgi:hypothetical protein